ncbi:MAG TPA: thioredoxin [Clostridia bacterium]|nr:thioredoxin [Clostridia bacterium]
MKPIKLTDQNFEKEVKESDKIVLVDFYADWCGPCKMLAPILDNISEEMPHIKVGKVNVDQENNLAQAFAVSSIPTLIVFKNGKIDKKAVGYQSKERLVDMLS